jgi:nitric oxide reductase subunit C
MEASPKKTIAVPTMAYRFLLAGMLAVFGVYNFQVYTSSSEFPISTLSDRASQGELLWQQSNCTACHQLYGLGGYLGPDLTNVISSRGKGENYVKAFLNSGINAMPKFNFDEQEKDDIVAFLTHVDQTGYFPNRGSEFQKSGWVKLKYKTSKSAHNE